MLDPDDQTPGWVLPPELWFPGPSPEALDALSEDPYTPDPYSCF